MATPIVMPRLGDFMMEGTVTSWAKTRGEGVRQGEVIAEIETEKINYDLEATESGIFHPLVEEGSTVLVDVGHGIHPRRGGGPTATRGGTTGPRFEPLLRPEHLQPRHPLVPPARWSPPPPGRDGWRPVWASTFPRSRRRGRAEGSSTRTSAPTRGSSKRHKRPRYHQACPRRPQSSLWRGCAGP